MSNASKILMQAAKTGKPLITRVPRKEIKRGPTDQEPHPKREPPQELPPPTWNKDFIPNAEDVPRTARKRYSVPTVADPAKRRRTCVSVSVSPEEEALLRGFANARGLNFSEWARIVMFHAAGQPLPKRS